MTKEPTIESFNINIKDMQIIKIMRMYMIMNIMRYFKSSNVMKRKKVKYFCTVYFFKGDKARSA